MARRHQQTRQVAAPMRLTYAEEVGHHVRRQADEALQAGMGMTAFLAWAASYTAHQGIVSAEAADIVVTAWTAAYDEWRDAEIEAA
jgi:hypothetical protein